MKILFATATAGWMHDFKIYGVAPKDSEITTFLLNAGILSVPRFLEYASRVLEIGPKELSTSKNDPPWARLQEAYKRLACLAAFAA